MDSFSLPTAPSIPINVDGEIVVELGEAVSYVFVGLARSKDSELSSDRYARHDGDLVSEFELRKSMS